MTGLNLIGPKWRILAGSGGNTTDISPYVSAGGYNFERSPFEVGKPLVWTGSLSLRPVLGVLGLNLDDRTNTLWRRGGLITVQVWSAGNYVTARTFFVQRAFYDEVRRLLEVDLVDILGLQSEARQPSVVGSNPFGAEISRRAATVAALTAAGIAEASINLDESLGNDTLNYNPTRFSGSLIQLAAELAAAASCWLEADSTGIVRWYEWQVPDVPAITRSAGRYGNLVLYERQKVGKVPPTRVVCEGSRATFQPYTPPTSTDVPAAAVKISTLPIIWGSSNPAQTAYANNTVIPQRTITEFAGDGISSLITTTTTRVLKCSAAAAGAFSFGYIYGVLTPTLDDQLKEITSEQVIVEKTFATVGPTTGYITEQVTTTLRPRFAASFLTCPGAPTPSEAEQLAMYVVERVTVEYAYTAGGVLDSTTTTTEVLQRPLSPANQNAFSASCNTGSQNDAAQDDLIVSGIVVNDNPDPTSAEVAPVGQLVETQGSGQVDDGTAPNSLLYREERITLNHWSTLPQLQALAAIERDILLGRFGYEIVLEWAPALAFAASPFVRIDVEKQGITRKFLVDAPRFAFQADRAACSFDGLDFGVVV